MKLIGILAALAIILDLLFINELMATITMTGLTITAITWYIKLGMK